MKYIRKIICRILFLYVVFGMCISCDINDFGEMNYDVKQPTKPVTSYLLTHSLRYIPTSLVYNPSGEPQYSYFVKYLSRTQYSEFYNMWMQGFPYYQSVLVNLNEIINQCENDETKAEIEVYGDAHNQLAVAKILRAYFFLNMTDEFGEIPYFEALKGQENIRPKFDTQKDIYNDLFKELEEAVDMITIDYINPLKGDFMFESDMLKWLKLANTTRLIMAMRISDVLPEEGKIKFKEAIAANGGVILSSSDDLLYKFIDDEEQANYNPFYYAYNSTVPAYVPNDMFVDYLKSENDPRLGVYANPSALNGLYIGKTLAAGQTDPNSVSLMGDALRQKETPLAIYTSSQVLFTMSEAVLKGWINGGEAAAEQYYNDAIAASFNEHNVFEEVSYQTYISQARVKFDVASAYEKIGTQKWLSLFPKGNEAWAEWRRLDYPVITPVQNALTEDGKIPVRNTYNDNIINLMPDQWKEVNERQPDKSYTKIWWDVN